jgi:hypothetical protein
MVIDEISDLFLEFVEVLTSILTSFKCSLLSFKENCQNNDQR